MTIEDLALKMADGFAKVNENFAKVDENFAKVNENHESLARMVAEGFDDITEKMATKQDLAEVKSELSEIKHEVTSVKSNVNNYLELSEKRYSELKQRDAILA